MVDTYGRWTEEKDYSTYPKEKLCDYDYMAIWIREQGYEPKQIWKISYLISFVSMRWKLEIMLVITIQRTETLMEHIVKLRKLM